jgi:hypothetical protein
MQVHQVQVQVQVQVLSQLHQGCTRVAEVQRCRGAEVQSCRVAELQRCRGAEVQKVQMSRYADVVQMHRCGADAQITEMQKFRTAEVWVQRRCSCRGAEEVQMCRCADESAADMQRCRFRFRFRFRCRCGRWHRCREVTTMVQRYRDTEIQRYRGQRCRGSEMLRCRG